MNVLYVMPGEVRRGPLGATEIDRRRALLQGWAAAGTTVEVIDAPGGPPSIESEIEEATCVPPMLAALEAHAGPVDATIVGCFGDPGLAAVRELRDEPVVGPFEASLHLAAQLGRRVGVVTVRHRLIPVLDGLVRLMGQEAIYAGAAAVDIGVLGLHEAGATLVAQLSSAAAPLLSGRYRADALVLGCMSLSFLEVDRSLSRELGVPVVNPARAALATAETMVRLGLRQSRTAYPPYDRSRAVVPGTHVQGVADA